MPLVGELHADSFCAGFEHRGVGRFGDVAARVLVAPEHGLAVVDPYLLLLAKPEPVEAVVRVDPVGVDDLALTIALEHDLAVLAHLAHLILTAPEADLAHIHPRFDNLADPVGRGEA